MGAGSATCPSPKKQFAPATQLPQQLIFYSLFENHTDREKRQLVPWLTPINVLALHECAMALNAHQNAASQTEGH